MWREILHALNDDTSTKELAESIVYGLVSATSLWRRRRAPLHEAIRPARVAWSHLKAPLLTDEIIDRIALGTEEQAGGKSIREMEAIRDECLVAIQRVLAKHDMGAGQHSTPSLSICAPAGIGERVCSEAIRDRGWSPDWTALSPCSSASRSCYRT